MRKWPKTESEDLEFVRKYCLLGTYPESDARCSYVKAEIMAKSSETSKGKSDSKDVDAIFLCRYPDENMPIHEAHLTSELDECPHAKRREMIDAFYMAKV